MTYGKQWWPDVCPHDCLTAWRLLLNCKAKFALNFIFHVHLFVKSFLQISLSSETNKLHPTWVQRCFKINTMFSSEMNSKRSHAIFARIFKISTGKVVSTEYEREKTSMIKGICLFLWQNSIFHHWFRYFVCTSHMII